MTIGRALTPLSRRKLLGGLALAATAAGANAAPVLRLGPAGRGTSFRSLAAAGAAAWAEQIGSEFRIRSENGVQSLILAEVRPLARLDGAGRRKGRDRAFALAFRSAGGPLPAGDRIYPLAHAQHGKLDIFFGPSGDRLVAIFA
ncbi:MAG: hypothetical protein QOJ94_2882 [Sphingomonadales bacterium]|jgi:hypothetical protein|nr:hypothetical protein [Sphingomonadales bacterium]